MEPADSDRRRLANQRGLSAEDLVAEHLRDLGWTVVAQRWQCEAGEIDLVVWREDALRIVEVKLRQPDDPGGLECIDARKLTRLRNAGEMFHAGWTGTVREICLLIALVEPTAAGSEITLLDDPD